MAGTASSGNRSHKRCTEEVKDKRAEEGAIWLIENPDSQWKDFISWACAKWDIKTDMANNYRKASTIKVDGIYSDDLESAKKIADSSLRKMLKKAIDDDDTKLALAIRQELNKINGLYTKKIEVTDVSEKPIFNITPIKTDSKNN